MQKVIYEYNLFNYINWLPTNLLFQFMFANLRG